MILTYKIKHNKDYSVELSKAKQIAEFAIKYNATSSAQVKQFGLKSAISNQILRKYGRNNKIKKVSSVNLIIPNQSINVDFNNCVINIPCIKLKLPYKFSNFTKVNQIEINNNYAFVSVTVPEQKQITPISWIGVDLNTTGHCCVAANPTTGKVLKLGKKAHFTHTKYKNQRQYLQKNKKFRLIKKMKNKESNITRDLNHKISRKVVNYAVENKAGIVLENLKGIRKNKKNAKSFRYSLNSWSFYQLQTFLEYKAKLLGIPVVKIDPAYTSQQCSKCGLLGNRNKKQFKCSHCGHVEDADVNASFSIALRHMGILRLPTDRDVGKGGTDAPERQPYKGVQTLEPHVL